ncbi:MAG: hypothetical protein DRR42_24880 [Gammaproteobacteria bacterium]|nr:MAG: hypothetical protein DRR42_24880 [Gammaproteobacteria bacterium]
MIEEKIQALTEAMVANTTALQHLLAASNEELALAGVAQTLSGETIEQVVEPVVEKPKRKRRSKAEVEAAKVAKAEAAAAAAAAVSSDNVPPAPPAAVAPPEVAAAIAAQAQDPAHDAARAEIGLSPIDAALATPMTMEELSTNIQALVVTKGFQAAGEVIAKFGGTLNTVGVAEYDNLLRTLAAYPDQAAVPPAPPAA